MIYELMIYLHDTPWTYGFFFGVGAFVSLLDLAQVAEYLRYVIWYWHYSVYRLGYLGFKDWIHLYFVHASGAKGV